MRVKALDHLVINVVDVERSSLWFQQVLGMRKLDYRQSPERSRIAMLFGDQRINLRPCDFDPDEWTTADDAAAGSQDICFLTEASPGEVLDHLANCGVGVIEGPVVREGALGSLSSVYCRDPDGNLIEIASYGPRD